MVAVFSYEPSMPYQPEAFEEDIVSTFAGTTVEQRASLLSRAFYRWPLSFILNRTNRDSMKAFWEARRGRIEAFYWKDRIDYARLAVPLTPDSDGVTLAFDLPSSGLYSGDYPIDDANVKLYRDAVLNGGALSADTDARQIVTDSAPAAPAKPMTADYHFYRLVRFEENKWRETFVSQAGVFRISLALREVPA